MIQPKKISRYRFEAETRGVVEFLTLASRRCRSKHRNAWLMRGPSTPLIFGIPRLWVNCDA
jgi:hypothetical protein